MKKQVAVTLFIALFSLVVNAQQWKTNFEDAKTEAKIQNKRIVLVFSGSDWCGPCIKLDKNVWQSAEFNKYAKDNYVMYRADFPKKKANQLPEELRKQNLALAEKYNEDGNYPFVLLLDADGKVLGVLGYLDLEASEYLDRIKELDKK
jgi:thioredoxin-related protein